MTTSDELETGDRREKTACFIFVLCIHRRNMSRNSRGVEYCEGVEESAAYAVLHKDGRRPQIAHYFEAASYIGHVWPFSFFDQHDPPRQGLVYNTI